MEWKSNLRKKRRNWFEREGGGSRRPISMQQKSPSEEEEMSRKEVDLAKDSSTPGGVGHLGGRIPGARAFLSGGLYSHEVAGIRARGGEVSFPDRPSTIMRKKKPPLSKKGRKEGKDLPRFSQERKLNLLREKKKSSSAHFRKRRPLATRLGGGKRLCATRIEKRS